MSEAIFQRGGALAHNAARAQEWCHDNLPGFGRNGVGLGNSPDLSPMTNLWAIMQGELNKTNLATSEKALVGSLQMAWSKISAETLDNLGC